MFFVFFFIYIKIINQYYKKHKENLRKEAGERYQNFLKKKKTKDEKRPKKYIKTLLKKKKKKVSSLGAKAKASWV